MQCPVPTLWRTIDIVPSPHTMEDYWYSAQSPHYGGLLIQCPVPTPCRTIDTVPSPHTMEDYWYSSQSPHYGGLLIQCPVPTLWRNIDTVPSPHTMEDYRYSPQSIVPSPQCPVQWPQPLHRDPGWNSHQYYRLQGYKTTDRKVTSLS
jgi:hypothetical protein